MTTLTPKEKWQPKFLASLEKRPIVARACRCASISRETAYRYRDEDPEFAKAWEGARQTGIDALEEKAWERAETISDTLMIFILKGQRPEVYRDTVRQEHTGADGDPIRIEDVSDVRTEILGSLAGLADANGEDVGALPPYSEAD